ncbi:unnamed protein product [Fraxinus pennsylvanica]|uniref:Nuclease associated modular domain-containing protein n=1 Tax=Fraxinus pennsylvanica TaxID=56036 RepID=A0AAD1ZBZ5_9LAMI|nr:unnamed protein product [Fraxinus pennsylvanica]
MPLLDIATAHPCSCFHNNILAVKSQIQFRNKFVSGNERRLALSFSWKSFCIGETVKKFNLESVGVWRGGLMIKAVATLESTCVTRKSEEVKEYQNTWGMNIDSRNFNSSMYEPRSSSEDPTEVDEREKLRRMRISKANKGNTPWNKGKKHSPETRQRIRERTRIAMQDPKVKMKLANLGHAQSEETRMRIGVGVRLGWEKRREKLTLQETGFYEWQNLIADTARRGVLGEEELQWDSYKVLNEQLELEWLQSVEQRKRMSRPKGSKRAPKSAEQRRKISEAISAKWADPAYRNRVCSALAKFHGIPDVVERKPRRKPSEGGQTRKRSPPKKKVNEKDNLSKPENENEILRIRLKRNNTPLYKDPLASSKLEMLKNIRTQRAAAENKKIEAVARAKLLIAEAEKAAAALEIAAKSSPLAQASLVETRMLIAEAIQSIESIKQGDLVSDQYDSNFQASSKLVPHFEEDISAEIVSPNLFDPRKVNGDQSSWSSDIEAGDVELDVLRDLLNGNASMSYDKGLLKIGGKHLKTSSDFPPIELNSMTKHSNFIKQLADDPKPIEIDGLAQKLPNGLKFQSENAAPPKQVTVTKKYIGGRLVEVAEEK